MHGSSAVVLALRTQRFVRVRAKAPAVLQAAARLVELQAEGQRRGAGGQDAQLSG